MAMSHVNCTHPRTPAGRAACRKAGGPGTVVENRADRRAKTHAEGCISPDHKGRCIVKVDDKPATKSTGTRTTPRPRKAASGALKRTGTAIRTTGDLADVPHVFGDPIRTAWDLGWTVKVGDPYNDRERRVVISGTNGEVALVWNTNDPNHHGTFFRPFNSSITSRVESAEKALGLAGKTN